MVGGIIAQWHDSNVRFRLRVVEQCKRALRADDCPAPERDSEDFGQPLDGVRVSGILRGHRHQHTFEQLESLVFEGAALDEPIIFRAQKRSNPWPLTSDTAGRKMSIARPGRSVVPCPCTWA